MNQNILNTSTQEFINKNLNSDIAKLALKGNIFKEIDTKTLINQVVAKQKSKLKLPTWFNTEKIYYPPKLSIEQTSSEITANYKASLLNGNTIVDLTGGFGVDCYAFSKVFKEVTHCELNEELSKIVKHNYNKLKADNITTKAINGLDFIKKSNSFDYIYIDPSRRDDVKGKVFLLKDCLPNVPENINLLFEKSNKILIKNSPMLDITATIKELTFVKEIHVVALNNEVKELLFFLEKDYLNKIKIKTVNITKNNTQSFEFFLSDAPIAKYNTPKKYIYEPNSAILKSGGFLHLCEKYNVEKLHLHSHLYTTDLLIDFPGRSFKVIKTMPYDKKQLKKEIITGKANITVRNFPKTVAQIRKETKIKDGGTIFLFFTKNITNKNIVLICEKIKHSFNDI